MGRYRLPPEWENYGARIGRDGLLYLGEWRRGFTVHELRAMFWDCQRVRSLERERSNLAGALKSAQDAQDRAERRAWWYRRQLVLESRLGMALARIGA